MSKLIQQLKAARRVSVPIVAIQTPDPAATVEAVCEAINGESPKLQWDLVRGFTSLNDAGQTAIADASSTDTTFNPIAALVAAEKLPRESVLFFHLAHRLIVDQIVLQAVWNLRDKFKLDRRMLILLGSQFQLPAELSGDVVLLDEPLPDAKQLTKIVRDQFDAAQLKKPDDESLTKAVDAIQGLPAFAAEQVTAMSLRKEGLDYAGLWERKRQQIEQTPGLRVYRGGETFSDIGGVDVVKGFLGKIMTGHARPNAVVFVDEIEKAMSGSRGDTSGVSQDQLGSLLSYMQDNQAAGMIFIGPPGSGKSLVAKAAGAVAGVPTIQLDLGAVKGSLVSQSEHQIRTAFKVITAVSNGKSLWICTCNAINELPPELRRRFTLGTFFFDLPSLAEREKIWTYWLKRFEFSAKADTPGDEGWTGAEIRQCCEIAWRLGCTLKEASEFIVPVSRSAADQIDKLRNLASGRFLSASYPGVFNTKREAETTRPKSGRRLVEA